VSRRLLLGFLIALGILFPVSITPDRGGEEPETNLAVPPTAARVKPDFDPVWADAAPAATGLTEPEYFRGR
jgi:hypothetical protein